MHASTPLAVSYKGSNGSANGAVASGRKHASHERHESRESRENIQDIENIELHEKHKGIEPTHDRSHEKRASRGQEDESRPSFSERASQLSRVPTPLLVKGDRILRDIDRAPPGDPPQLRVRRKSGPASAVGDGGGGQDVARQRSQYFEDAFSARDGNASPAKERVRSEALVLAELRTNVIIGDEFTLITELAANLAVRYRRPLSSVVVTLQHNSCMCFGGSFDPAYVMSVFALPAELQPTTNKRNAALIQRHMEEALGVPPARGLLRFAPVPEANLAYGGKTTAGHVDDLPKQASVVAVATAVTSTSASTSSCQSPVPAGAADMHDLGGSSRKSRAGRRLSVKSLSSFRSPSPPSPTPPFSTVNEDQHQHHHHHRHHHHQQRHSLPLAQLPSIIERSPKKSPQVMHRVGRQKERTEHSGREGTDPDVGKETLPETSPSATWQPSRRARRTKSFVATLFGRSAIKYEMGSP